LNTQTSKRHAVHAFGEREDRCQGEQRGKQVAERR
jgi:hypothetical protein